jgi:hypothetical protein
MRPFENRVEHGDEIARRSVDDLQDLGDRRPLGQCLVALGLRLIQVPLRFVPLGFALGKLTLQIGYELLGIG